MLLILALKRFHEKINQPPCEVSARYFEFEFELEFERK